DDLLTEAEPVEPPDGDDRAGDAGRAEARMVLVALAQRGGEAEDVLLADRRRIGDPALVEVRGVATQVAAVRAQGVLGQSPLHREVGEVLGHDPLDRRALGHARATARIATTVLASKIRPSRQASTASSRSTHHCTMSA